MVGAGGRGLINEPSVCGLPHNSIPPPVVCVCACVCVCVCVCVCMHVPAFEEKMCVTK